MQMKMHASMYIPLHARTHIYIHACMHVCNVHQDKFRAELDAQLQESEAENERQYQEEERRKREKKEAEEAERVATALQREREEEEARREKEEKQQQEEAERRADEKRREEEEAKASGEVALKYEQYTEEFHIHKGSLSAAEVDDKLALSFVMPNCMILLSTISPGDRYTKETDEGVDVNTVYPLIATDDRKMFRHLVTGGTYYVIVEENDEQKRADMAKNRTKWQQHQKANAKMFKSNDTVRTGVQKAVDVCFVCMVCRSTCGCVYMHIPVHVHLSMVLCMDGHISILLLHT